MSIQIEDSPAFVHRGVMVDTVIQIRKYKNTKTQIYKYTNSQMSIQIEDSPAFVHRGVMLDTARNFIPIINIKQVLPPFSSPTSTSLSLLSSSTFSVDMQKILTPSSKTKQFFLSSC